MKNFLDEFPQYWENKPYKQLRDLLVDYADPNGITPLRQLANEAGINKGKFPENYPDTITTSEQLIKEMGRQGKLRRLVEEASKSNQIGPDIASQFEELLVLPQRQTSLLREKIEPKTVFVESGPFFMGRKTDSALRPEDLIYEKINLDAFHIGMYPVSNKEYFEFLKQNKKITLPFNGLTRARLNPEQENIPISGVNWYDAMTYCKWLSETTSADRRYTLPSEAQWEKAARGTDGRLYPWGDDWDENKCNVDPKNITPVKHYSQWESPYKCIDMVGNVPEWTITNWGACRRKPDAYYRNEWKKDGKVEVNWDDENDQIRRVTRGGMHWKEGEPIRCSWRRSQLPYLAGLPHLSMGFRVVMILGNG